jgi:hypothetical protein
MLLRTEVAIAAYSQPAKWFSTELAGSGIHYQANYRGKDLSITRIKGVNRETLTKVK